MKNLKTKNNVAIILILLAAALFFFKLGAFSLYDAAETTYGEFIKQMRLTGDWITFHYNGEIIFDKPPLYYWLAAVATYIFGFNEFAIRFWAAFCGVMTVVATYFLGKSFHSERTGWFSAIIAMTAFQFLIQSRIAEIDILLTLLITLSFLCFWHGYHSKNKKLYWLMYLCMALAAITKGIIGIALPGFAIFLFLMLKKEADHLLKLELIPGALIILLVAAPWYLIELYLHGQKFVDFFLGFLFLSRFQGVVSGHPGPWYYYFLALILGFAPWSHFVPYALFRTWKNRFYSPELLTLCFILPVFIVFSIAKTKLPNYMLPLYPFLAVMAGKLWDDFLGPDQPNMRKGMTVAHIALLIVTALIIIGFIIMGTSKYTTAYQELVPNLLLLAGVLVSGSLISIIFYFLNKYLVSFTALPVMIFAITLVLTTQTLPAVEKYKGEKELGAKVAQSIKKNEQIAAFNVGNRPGVVYYNSKTILFLENEKEAANFIKNKKGYCFTTIGELNKLKKYGKIFAEQGELAVIH